MDEPDCQRAVLEIQEASAQKITVSDVSLTVDLVDGRTIIVPLVWYPRLWYGTPEERNHFEIIGDGTLIHWPDLDEDLSVSGLLAGRRSRGESTIAEAMVESTHGAPDEASCCCSVSQQAQTGS